MLNQLSRKGNTFRESTYHHFETMANTHTNRKIEKRLKILSTYLKHTKWGFPIKRFKTTEDKEIINRNMSKKISLEVETYNLITINCLKLKTLYK